MRRGERYKMIGTRERHLGTNNGTSKGILIAIEDTGKAYDFYLTYLKKNYKIEKGDLLGVGGADNFNEELLKKNGYDTYIIIYDSGVEQRKLNKIRRALQNLRKNTDSPIYTFTPKCFEEILLSFSCLEEYVRPNQGTDAYKVYCDIQMMMQKHGNIINYFGYEDEQIVSEEKKVEQYIETLTHQTVFEYTHASSMQRSIMSDCWIRECCQFDKSRKQYDHVRKQIESCKGFEKGSIKTNIVAKNSLLGVLDDFLEKEIHNKNCNSLPKLNEDKRRDLWGEI